MGGESCETDRDKKIVIGFGTGRCGTKSLAHFLNQQPGFHVTHENVPFGWYPALADIDQRIKTFTEREAKVIGDVGFYWVHYLGIVLRRYHNVKIINIVRPDEEVVESFWEHGRPLDAPNVAELCKWRSYPFNALEATKDAIRQTLLQYRFLENQLMKLYPGCIYQIATEQLNDKRVLDDMLSWIGEDGLHVLNPIHENTRAESRRERDNHLQLIRNGCFINRLKRRFGGVKQNGKS